MTTLCISKPQNQGSLFQLTRDVRFKRKHRFTPGDSSCWVHFSGRITSISRMSPRFGGANAMIADVYHNPRTCAHSGPILEYRGKCRDKHVRISRSSRNNQPAARHTRNGSTIENTQVRNAEENQLLSDSGRSLDLRYEA